MTLRIEIDRDACMGSGNCLFWAAGVFDLDDDGVAIVLDPDGAPEDRVLLAMEGCPTKAITVIREDACERSAMTDLPIVLVHGGGHGSWCWEPTIEHLTGEVLAVDLPPKEVRGGPQRFANPPELLTLTVADFAASVLTDVDAAGYDRFVLVGHSMAGLTIPEVARLAPERVAHLVFLSCSVPPEGGSIVDILTGSSGEHAIENIERVEAQQSEDPGAGPGVERPQLSEARLIEMFCNDMDETQTRFVLDHFGNEALPVVMERVSRVGVSPEIPKTWIRLLRDAIMTVELQAGGIANLEASPGGSVEVIDLDAGHNAMISQPEALAEILGEIGREIRRGIAAPSL